MKGRTQRKTKYRQRKKFRKEEHKEDKVQTKEEI
jgi:hypothetical protein